MNYAESEQVIKIEGRRPSTDELSWIKLGRDSIKQSPDLANDIAKTLVTLSTTLITIYIGILTFLKIFEKISAFYIPWLLWIIVAFIIVSPFLLWIYNIHKNVNVYSPRLIKFDLDCTQDIKDSMTKIIEEKSE